MCYDASSLKKSILKKAEHKSWILPKESLGDHFIASGFLHPHLPVLTTEKPHTIQHFEWGLVPEFTANEDELYKIQNMTINARSETLLEKKSFKDSIEKGQRCVVLLSGFFEHHHRSKKKFPYYITYKNDELMYAAGVYAYNELKEVPTFSILTTRANNMMSDIHNNPEAMERTGPRMPVFIAEEQMGLWLNGNLAEQDLPPFFEPLADEALKSHPVKPIRGKASPGNVPEALQEQYYFELNTLF